MIRINLLPIKQARRRSAARTQLILFTGLILLELVVFGVVWMAESSQLEDIQADVSKNEAEVEEKEKEVEQAEELEREKEELEKQVSILNELEEKRTGPVRVLDELQVMLSPPRDEEDRHRQAGKDWNTEWNPRRLWINTFSETDGEFNMEGMALSADDVAEFLERLSSGEHFGEVELDFVRAQEEDGVRLVTFRVTGQLSYTAESDDDSGDDS